MWLSDMSFSINFMVVCCFVRMKHNMAVRLQFKMSNITLRAISYVANNDSYHSHRGIDRMIKLFTSNQDVELLVTTRDASSHRNKRSIKSHFIKALNEEFVIISMQISGNSK